MKSTWFFLLLACSLTCALDQEFVDEFLEKMQEFGAQCAEETDATSDDIAELIARKLPPSTHEGKCMIFCMQKKFNMMKENGGIDRAGAIAALKPLQKADPELHQKVLKIFVTCGMRVKPSPDPCDTATELALCGKKEAEAIGLEDALLT
ncbi:odorant binding protein 17 [Tribolium castaneum]|uniref:Odorant binding protein 17 n=2 Tax=Tribolium castaneum TaxID=7070 RepID=D2A1G3_TRICA|nr:PREDICTED: uncharacterized protein LOC657254 [Tribolium castaneum]EFA02861.1 odorant binding protein 17 [Tribolium castaneum]|eukprot:XP_968815.1 PREDICTED: uncharacterized protein LOC657254 [Tribolium castaneum]